MKVLVSGAAGFIGFHLCKRLLKDKLLNPIIEEQELNKRYQWLDNF